MENKDNNLSWTTEKRKVSELKGYSKNPRNISKEQFQHLVNSIAKFGYVEIVAIDADNTIIAGHMRIKALKSLKRGSEMIEVRVPSRKLTEEEFDEYLVRSNLNTGDWSWDLLGNLFNPIDLVNWGFSPDKLLDCKMEDLQPEEEQSKKKKKLSICPQCGHEF